MPFELDERAVLTIKRGKQADSSGIELPGNRKIRKLEVKRCTF